jgi:PAS domain S-box-containing protein
LTGERILIIEGDPEHVEFLLTNVLSPQGYLAQTATCGQLGLQAAQEERPDLVLLGLSLQDKTVTEMLQQLQMYGNPPVILMIAPGTEAEALQELGQNTRDALIKPFTAEEITLSIAYALHQDRLAEERDELVRKLAAANAELERSLSKSQELHRTSQALLDSLDFEDVLNVVVQAAVSLTHAQRGYLFLQKANSNSLCLRTMQNLGRDYAPGFCVQAGHNIADHVMRNGEPVLLPHKSTIAIKRYKHPLDKNSGERVRSLICVPLQSQGQTIGVLGVDNVTAEQDLTQRDVTILSTLAGHASVAIRNAQIHTRLAQTLERRTQERLALQALGKITETPGDASHIAAQALTHAMQITGAQQGSVGFWNAHLPPDLVPSEQAGEEITWIDANGTLCSPPSHLENLVRRALDCDAPQWSQDTTPSPADERSASCVYLAAPIQNGDKILGAIGLQIRTALFSDLEHRADVSIQEDLRFLGDLADHVADQIHHVRLLAEITTTNQMVDPILQNMSEGVCTVNSGLYITSVNPALERITGWQENELLGHRYDEIFAPKIDGQRLRPEQTLPGQVLYTQSAKASTRHTILRQDGHRISVASTAFLPGNADAGVIVTIRDLTPEMELRQLRHAFKALAAHSLRTPLTHITLSAEALCQTDLPDDVRHEILDMFQNQSLQIEQLNEKVLNALGLESRTASSHYHPVTLKPIIEQVVRYFQTMAVDRSLQVILTPDLPFVIGDENKIELALASIIDNALILGDTQQPLVISTSASNDHVIIAVERLDEPIPAGEGKKPSLPPPPVNGKNTFSGDHKPLERELQTARKLIQAQGGQIWTETHPGMSTRFCFSLPKMEVRDGEQALVD